MQKGLTANQIKLIAIFAMTVDHLAWTLFPGYDTRWFVLALHLIGRITAPIMWFFIAEGYFHTRNVKKYAARLFSLALISHFAYNFCFGIPIIPLQTSVFNQTSVAWPLAWGLVLLLLLERKLLKSWQELLLIGFVCLITFPSDWSCIAAMAIVFMGTNRGNFTRQMGWMVAWIGVYALVYVFFIDVSYGILQLGTCLSIPILKLYNGQRGNCKYMGKLFYYYYPVHLFFCGIIRIFHT